MRAAALAALALTLSGATPSATVRSADVSFGFAADGRHVLFARGDEQTAEHAVDPSRRVEDLASRKWSPDGRWVAMTTPAGTTIANAVDETPHAALGKVGWLNWSRTGTTLAFTSFNGAIDVAAGDGSDAHAVSIDIPPCTEAHCSDLYDDPVPSPDGTRIAFAFASVPGDVHDPQSSLYVVPAAGGKPVAIGGGDICAPDSDIRWSPDGTWISYWTADCYEDLSFGPALVRADGKAHADAVNTGAYDWGPRGHAFAYRTRRGIALLVPPGKPRIVAPAGDFDWSPDGKRMVVGRGGTIDVGAIGGRFHRIARGWSPSWSHALNRISYAVESCGPRQGIHLVRADGSGDVRLTQTCAIRVRRVAPVVGTRYDDEIFAIDRHRERVACGAGHDAVHADAVDILAADCEERAAR